MKISGSTALILIANLFLATIVPIVTNVVNPELFSASDNIIVGLLLLISASLFEIFLMTKAVFDIEKREVEFWAAKSATDADLLSLRATFHEVSRNSNLSQNLFASYISEQVQDVRRAADEALFKKEITLSKRHVDTTDALLLGFRGATADVFRATNLLWDIDTFFDVTYRQYLYDFNSKVEAGMIVEVRRLFLYRNVTDLNDSRALRLFAFHSKTQRMTGRIIPVAAFRRLLKDYAPPGVCEDFGIFADRYVYRAINHGVDEITGSFSADEHVIKSYTSFFDACWRSPLSVSVDDLVTAGIALPALFQEVPVPRSNHAVWGASTPVPPVEASDGE